MPVDLKELVAKRKRFKSTKDYSVLKASCERAVVEWRWATSHMLPALPHDDIVRGFKAPKWAKKQPRYGILHGLDAAGRIQCMRGDDLAKPSDQVYEQFLIHEDDGFWCVYFSNDPKKSVLIVKWFEVDQGRWSRSLQLSHHGFAESVLHWKADRLEKHVRRNWESPTVAKPTATKKEEVMTIESYAYAAEGELAQVTQETHYEEGEPPIVEVKYQRVPKGESLDSLLSDVENMLVAEIPKAVRAAKIKQPVYALMIQFTGVDTDMDGYCPPLFLPSERLRENLLSKNPAHAASELWAVPEWETDPAVRRIVFTKPKIDEKLHMIFQLTIVQPSSANYGPVRKMFQRLCARLNAHSWNGILPTTSDFIVVPFDPHFEFDFQADLKASVPAEKLRTLIKRGFVQKNS